MNLEMLLEEVSVDQYLQRKNRQVHSEDIDEVKERRKSGSHIHHLTVIFILYIITNVCVVRRITFKQSFQRTQGYRFGLKKIDLDTPVSPNI